jgi:hypothetical protein
MTTLVKSDTALATEAPRWRAHVAPDSPPNDEDPTIRDLRAEIADLRQRMTELARENEQQVARARADGVREAQARFNSDEAARMARVEAALRSIDRQLQSAMSDVEALALVITKGALEAVFDDSADIQEQVVRSIGRQLRVLRRECIARITVSADDFSDDAALKAVRARLDLPHVEVETHTGLKSGDSRLELSLGDIEISLSRYWDEILTRLASAARGDAS